jgi:hypothetical protein
VSVDILGFEKVKPSSPDYLFFQERSVTPDTILLSQ